MKKKTSAWPARFLQGTVIGIANIIPGVSGGTMMAAMGIYPELIASITHLFSRFKKAIRFLFPLGCGMVIALLALSKVIDYSLEFYPIATNLCFCGLILGTMPALSKSVLHKGWKKSYGYCFLAMFAFILLTAFLSEESGTNVTLSLEPGMLVLLFVAGVVSAASMVIPGISGSMILMLMGCYEPILGLISTGIDALIHFNVPLLFWCAGVALPFAIGMVLGVFLVAKAIEWILKKWPMDSMWGILGLVVASPIAILIKTNWSLFTWGQFLIGIVAFIVGTLIAWLISRMPSVED